jgi:glycosyltransferase involved in cell wall biosynthesis
MRVGFDMTLHGVKTTGAGEYQRQLLAHLPCVAADLDMVVYTSRGAQLGNAAGAETREMPWRVDQRAQRILRGAVSWRRRWRTDNLDVFHVPFYFLPFGAPAKSIVTIYDTRFLRFPNTYPAARAAFLKTFVPGSLRRAGLVLTISEFSKREIVELVGLDPDRIRVTLLAPREQFTPVSQPEIRARITAKYRLPGSFILSTSTLEPRKNLARAVEAYASLRKAGLQQELVLVGVHYFGAGDIQEAIARNGLSQAVHIPGYVDDADMPELYRMADAFIYPSLYEGFGIPPLEAMACGTPVVAANSSSIPEVVGQAAKLVDPLSVASIADGIRQVLTDPGESERLSSLGLERVKLFSWNRTATQTAGAYRELHEQRSR